MWEIARLARQIEGIGFHCAGCGSCCTAERDPVGFVMLSPAEVTRIGTGTGLLWNQIAVPYPEFIESAKGVRLTLSWCLRCTNGRCSFLQEGKCSVYHDRPWICRTYPFMLEGDTLQVSTCEGIGQPIAAEDA
ncbi:MAG: YkgJ family cysteine cluster protein, partial [Methanomicrobiales archaeon]|nr:YkgJ family cysteine cluster protein [Methanomicrobiales archaeon]